MRRLRLEAPVRYLPTRRVPTAFAVLILATTAASAARPRQGWVRETKRRIPVADSVDVVVVGGSTGAVSAAASAARAGASVFLVTDRTYLGEDLCAHTRLWLEEGDRADAPLARAIFSGRGPVKPLHVKRRRRRRPKKRQQRLPRRKQPSRLKRRRKRLKQLRPKPRPKKWKLLLKRPLQK